MPTTDPLAAAVLLAVAVPSAFVVAYGVSELRLASLVLGSRPGSVLETTEGGSVELRGEVAPIEETIRAPFSGVECVACVYEVEERRGSGNDWRTIDSGEEYVPFLLDDGSGRVLIEPPGADFRFSESDRIAVDGGTRPPERIARYIDREEGVDSQDTSIDLRVFEIETGDDRRFIERRLEAGDEIHVLGTARHDTTVATRSGQVNAAVGIDERALAPGWPARFAHAVVGFPFLVSNRSERRLGLTAGAVGVASIVAGAAVVVGTAALL